MSDATDRLRAFLTISPSVVFPDEVLDLFEPVETEVTRLTDENEKLRKLVAYLMFVKPYYVKTIHCKGKLLRFDDLLAEVGMRWEDMLADVEMRRESEVDDA